MDEVTRTDGDDQDHGAPRKSQYKSPDQTICGTDAEGQTGSQAKEWVHGCLTACFRERRFGLLAVAVERLGNGRPSDSLLRALPANTSSDAK